LEINQINRLTFALLPPAEFWENWYIIGENDPGDAPDEEFKFVFYNGKTRQNTYEGAFIYSRTQELSPRALQKVYKIAKDAGMNPDQFCRIRNQGCFAEDNEPATRTIEKEDSSSNTNPFLRAILASTRVSELLGVEPVAAQDTMRRGVLPTAQILMPHDNQEQVVAVDSRRTVQQQRSWWFEVGDYLENPHRHFAAMDRLRQPMEWPVDIVLGNEP
jgi:hypothetical protein